MLKMALQARMFGVRVKKAKSCLVMGILVLLFVPAVCAQSSNQSVFATGLNNPRGLKFGPDRNLYVAEGGAGGSLSTIGLCEQANGAGPYTGDFNARISKIAPNGAVTTVVDGLPSSQTNAALGNLVSGVADVAFIHGKLYAILAGAGCSHGLQGTDNGVIRVHSGGTWSMIANLSDFQKSHPVANPEPDDFEPDGTWYGMTAVHSVLYAVEPNHGGTRCHQHWRPHPPNRRHFQLPGTHPCLPPSCLTARTSTSVTSNGSPSRANPRKS